MKNIFLIRSLIELFSKSCREPIFTSHETKYGEALIERGRIRDNLASYWEHLLWSMKPSACLQKMILPGWFLPGPWQTAWGPTRTCWDPTFQVGHLFSNQKPEVQLPLAPPNICKRDIVSEDVKGTHRRTMWTACTHNPTPFFIC